MYTIAEELILLGTDDEEGTTISEAVEQLDYCLVGAIMAELAIDERIELKDDKVVVLDETPTGISYFNSVLAEIKDAKRLHDVKHWLEQLSGRKSEINEPIHLSLVDKGILKEEEKSFFFVFNQSVYPAVDDKVEEGIRSKVNRIIFEEVKPDAKSAMLLSLIHSSNLTEEVFGESRAAKAGEQINALMEDNEYGNAVKQSIEDIETAILSATTTLITTTVIMPDTNNL